MWVDSKAVIHNGRAFVLSRNGDNALGEGRDEPVKIVGNIDNYTIKEVRARATKEMEGKDEE